MGMPFFKSVKKQKIRQRRVSLQVQKSEKKKIKLNKNRKRAYPFVSYGSITIEAAISMTLFSLVMIMVLGFIVMINTQLKHQIKNNNIAMGLAKARFVENEIRNDEEHSHVVMLNGTNIFSEMKDVVIELIVRLNQSPVEDELGTYEAKRIGLAYSFSMTDEEIEEMISEAKEEGTYEEMKEEIEADIKRAKYLQTISIRKTK